jgi:hypothetical protein
VLCLMGNYYLSNSLLLLFTTSLLPFLAAISFVGLYVLLGAVFVSGDDICQECATAVEDYDEFKAGTGGSD